MINEELRAKMEAVVRESMQLGHDAADTVKQVIRVMEEHVQAAVTDLENMVHGKQPEPPVDPDKPAA